MGSVSASRSRSSSPPSSNDSPVFSHSSPESSDFLPTDAASLPSVWKSHSQAATAATAPNGYAAQSMLKADAPVNAWNSSGFALTLGNGRRVKTDEENAGIIFSEFIQEDAFDPTPLPHIMYAIRPDDHRPSGLPDTGVYDFSDTLDVSQSYSPIPSLPGPSSLPPSKTINPQQAQHDRPQPTHLALPSGTGSPPQHPPTTAVPDGPIRPPKASCSNLLINITNLPDRGAKSRVETQIKMDLQLVMPVSTAEGPSSSTTFRPVASWKWLRLNKGAATKRRPKKDAKQETTIEDTLYLSTEVTCATAPYPKVHACSSCISREAKRVERKKATRVRPLRSESEDEASAVPKAVAFQIKAEENESDDGSRIVLFNCPELLDFSLGSASLPVRITCYCRHHREKVGFRIAYTMRDASGRVVGRGTSPPIMITDDHKSTQKNSAMDDEDEEVEFQTPQQKRKRRLQSKKDSVTMEQGGDIVMDGLQPDEDDTEDPKNKRRYKVGGSGSSSLRKSSVPNANTKHLGSRPGTTSGRSSRRGTPSRRSSPSASAPVPPLVSRSSAAIQPISVIASYPASQSLELQPTSPYDFNAMAAASAGTLSMEGTEVVPQTELQAVLASLDALNSHHMSPSSTPTGNPVNTVEQSPSMVDLASGSPFFPMHAQFSAASGSPSAAVTAPTSPLVSTHPLGSPIPLDPSLGMLAGSFFSANLFPSAVPRPSTTARPLGGSSSANILSQAPPSTASQSDSQPAPPPVIHRLIPSSGPVLGGIEVTILGANFVPNLQCVFGNAVASSTQFWSENTMVCLLPPSPSPGPVMVWIKDVQMGMDHSGAMAGGVDSLLGLGSGVGTGGIQFFTYLDNADRALMELALQVVGLKMTGRIEDARNVAMRIVGSGSNIDMGGGSGSSGGGGQSVSGSDPMDGDATDRSPAASRRGSAADLSSLAAHLTSPSRSRDFQSVVMEFLSLMDVKLEEHPSIIPMGDAISQPNATGQTLLHLAAILGFHRLVNFLVTRGADIDARDKNGFTALHFAATCGRLACARTLVDCGADLEVVESWGRRARQLARLHDQADVEMLLQETETRQNLVSEEDYDGDVGASVSAEDAEDEDEDEAKLEGEGDDDTGLWMGRRGLVDSPMSPESVTPRTALASRVQSALPSRVGSHITFADLHSPRNPGSDLYSSEDEAKSPDVSNMDSPTRKGPVNDAEPVKPASIVDASATWIHRTLKHLQPPPKMVPELPWALPNLQMPGIAFPMQVQWPGAWQPADGEKVRTYYDLAALRAWYGGTGGWWSEKTRLDRRPPPPTLVPMYTPSEDEVASPVAYEDAIDETPAPGATPSKAVIQAKLARRLGYDPGYVTDKEIHAYSYYSKKMKRLKQDRMLVLFWLPILLIVFAWGIYESLPVAFAAAKTTVESFIPFQDPLRV